MARLKDKRARNLLTLFAAIILIVLGIRYLLLNRRDLIFDVIASTIITGFFYMLYNRLHQDYKSYFFLLFTLILHDLFLYNTMPFGIRFEYIMHFVGGFTIAIVTDRAFNEKLSKAKRIVLLLIFALGIGVVGEIIEWSGYKVFGLGEGFFKFGAGDEGGWDNSIFDLFANSIGAISFCLITLLRKNKISKISYKNAAN